MTSLAGLRFVDSSTWLESSTPAGPASAVVSIRTLLANAAIRAPGATAVVDDRGAFNYTELAALADRFAAWLWRRGVSAECRVEPALDGGLFAIVPLQAVLRLDRASNLLWSAPVAAHHDLHVAEDGRAHVLTERPRALFVDGEPWTILDNEITELSPTGRVERSWSLYDILRTDRALAGGIEAAVAAKRARFPRSGWPTTSSSATAVRQARVLLSTGRHAGGHRDALRLLRQLPGSPCDVLHTNTVERLGRHPCGLWQEGQWLISLRELDMIAVIDVDAHQVVWSWGHGELSGQHQPSALPGGTILVFDNGVAEGRSRLLEVDPRTDAVVWHYTATPPESFFSAVAGGCERLPNGNVLATQARGGRAFEVTRDGRILWEWVAPPVDGGARRSRASIYRLSLVSPAVVGEILAVAGVRAVVGD